MSSLANHIDRKLSNTASEIAKAEGKIANMVGVLSARIQEEFPTVKSSTAISLSIDMVHAATKHTVEAYSDLARAEIAPTAVSGILSSTMQGKIIETCMDTLKHQETLSKAKR